MSSGAAEWKPHLSNYWKLGAFVFGSFFLAFAALIWLGATHFGKQSFPGVTYLDESVEGLVSGSSVKFRGVPVGVVDGITVAPDKRHIQVTCNFFLDAMRNLGLRTTMPDADSDFEFLAPEMRISLSQAGLTGPVLLDIDVSPPGEAPPLPDLGFPPPWNYIPSAPSALKSLMDNAMGALDRVPPLLDGMTAAVNHLDASLQGMDLPGVSARLQRLLDDADSKLAAVDAAKLAATLDEATATLHEIRGVISRLGAEKGPLPVLLTRLDSTAAAMEEAIREARLGETAGALRQTSRAMEGLALDARGLTRDLDRDLEPLQQALEAMRALAELLARDPSSLLFGHVAREPGAEED